MKEMRRRSGLWSFLAEYGGRKTTGGAGMSEEKERDWLLEAYKRRMRSEASLVSVVDVGGKEECMKSVSSVPWEGTCAGHQQQESR